jgi:uncharacterized membrane protein
MLQVRTGRHLRPEAFAVQMYHCRAMVLAAGAATSGQRLRRQGNERRQNHKQHRRHYQIGEALPHCWAIVLCTTAMGLRRRNAAIRSFNGILQLYSSENVGLSKMRYILAILALAGMVVSYLALRVHYETGTAPCSINEKWDCGIVNHSPYAVFHGIPVAEIGMAGYFLIVVLALMRRRGWLLIATVIGLGFALYLSNIEAHVLGVWCLYCVISQGLIAILMILSMAWWGASLRNRTST